MKKVPSFILLFLCTLKVFASHIVGGEVLYKYLGPGSTTGTSKYQISVRLFRDCDVDCGEGTNVACLPQVAIVTIFGAGAPYTRVNVLGLPLKDSSYITLNTYPSCIYYKPPVCYEIKTYTDTISLADNNEGYIIANQDCCRAAAINQYGLAQTISGIPGATYTANIPGNSILPAGHNNSAVFKLKDTALVCLDSRFSIDFSADDADGDSLSYDFAAAYDGGDFFYSGCTYTDLISGGGCNTVQPAGPPPYKDITYNTNDGFSGAAPLGKDVSINPATGIISGAVYKQAGHYIVNVLVYEWRNNKVIASHQKDFIIHVENCNIPEAKLEPFYQTCDGFKMNFENESASPLIFSYYWDFGDIKNVADTSTSPTPTYNFPDSGIYTVTLITNKGQECSDSTTTLAKVYPGFIPDFSAKGGCVLSPYEFTDLTKSKYGTVNSWRWNFGDYPVKSDTSIIQNPEYLYPLPQQTAVTLIVGNSKGCLDTILKQIVVYDKPPLKLPFKDTLVCAKDTLLLQAMDSLGASATFSWSPALNISNTNIANPVVYPKSTTVYHIAVNDKGCTNTDSVKVNVIPFVVLDLGADTTICLTDSIQLLPETNALYFTWSPPTGISDVKIKNPFVKPLINTAYKLFASIGNCSASGDIIIRVAPYPKVVSGADTTICFGKTADLIANTSTPFFTWSPANSLLQANTLTPTARPQTTTSYIITVRDAVGCPKPVSDTTVVTVIPPVQAFAGRDTIVVVDQPLQLNATGGIYYSWIPATGMNDPGIPNPVVIPGSADDSVLYHVTVTTAEGCSAVDDINVIVFKTKPDIFIASAFTPNNDGLNDIIHPKVIGMKQFNYFRVYNRWGQMLFSTSALNKGWDGTVSGTQQPADIYVYMAQAIDYTGKLVTRKGTIMLIR